MRSYPSFCLLDGTTTPAMRRKMFLDTAKCPLEDKSVQRYETLSSKTLNRPQ